MCVGMDGERMWGFKEIVYGFVWFVLFSTELFLCDFESLVASLLKCIYLSWMFANFLL